MSTASFRTAAVPLSAALLLHACEGRAGLVTDGEAVAFQEMHCLGSASSRWLPRGAAYRAVAEYGRTEEPGIGSHGAMTYSPEADRLYLLDPLGRTIHVLSPDLQYVMSFGRAGRGPGELALQGPHGPRHGVAVGDSSLFVTDLVRVQEFDLDGGFRRQLAAIGPAEIRIGAGLLRLGVAGKRVYFASDAADIRSGQRAVEILDADAGPMLHREPMPDLPQLHGRYELGNLQNQAQPLVAFHGSCAVISDGATGRLTIIELERGTAAAIDVPEPEIPQETEADRRQRERSIAEVMRMAGQVPRGSPGGPTALRRWAGLIVDPDGAIWLEPWRPHSLRDQPFYATIVSAGSVTHSLVHAFPQEFGPPGVYYASTADPATGVPVVVRYQLSPAGN